MDIASWLRTIGLGQYERVFRDNDIDAEVLPELNADDLIAIGIASVGHRRKLLAAMSALRPGSAPEVLHRHDDAPEPRRRPDAERRQITVMFCDLVGSTELSTRLDPEDMGRAIHSYQTACSDAVKHWGGHVAKFMGDGILVYFGWPHAHEDDAERAVRAGLDLTRSAAKLCGADGTSLEVRVGIATGLVMVGDLIGEGAAQEQAVVGDTPNLAARLQGLATPGTVVIGSSTRRLLGALFDLQDLGCHALKGFSEPMQAWSVIGASRAESRFDALRMSSPAALVGRGNELAMLDECWKRARAGEGRVVLIAGEAGIGKSRLVHEQRERLHDEPHFALSYYCSPYHTNSALRPVVEQLERAAGFTPADDPAVKLGKLKVLLGQGSDVLEDHVSLIGELLSIIDHNHHSAPNLTAQQRKQRTLDALVGQLEGLANRHPVLLLFEDVHWIDPSTLELLDEVVERVAKLPVLTLITYRPEFVPTWTGLSHVDQLPLNRLDRGQVAALVTGIAGGRQLPPVVLERILAGTDGVPLFAEEVTKAVLVSEWLIEAGRRYEVIRPLPAVAIPGTLSDSLMSRLDRLGSVKEVAQIASVIGREFPHELLAALCPLEKSHLDAALGQLIAAGLIFRHGTPPTARYSFKHALVRDAGYASLLRDTRKRLHRQLAETLSAVKDVEPSLLAHHWEHAGETKRALDCLLRAGDVAAGRFAVWEAVAHFWHAARLLDGMPKTDELRVVHLRIVLSLIDAATSTSEAGDFWNNDGEREAAFRHIDEALAIATASGAVAAQARLEAFKGKNQHDDALLASAARHASEIGDRRLEADIARQRAGNCGNMGRFDESAAHVDRAIELFESLGARVELGFAMASYGRCYRARAGRLLEALRLAERARRIAEETQDPKLRSWLAMESEAHMYRGAWRETTQVAQEHLPFAWSVGNWAVILWSSAFATVAEVKLGNLDHADALIGKELVEAAPPAGDDFPKIYPQIALGQLRLAQGANDLAMAAAKQAMSHTERAMLPQLELGAAHRMLGEAHQAEGSYGEAVRHFEESLSILRAIQSRPELGQSLMAYGRHKLRDDPAVGLDYMNSAVQVFTEIDADGWINEVNKLLLKSNE